MAPNEFGWLTDIDRGILLYSSALSRVLLKLLLLGSRRLALADVKLAELFAGEDEVACATTSLCTLRNVSRAALILACVRSSLRIFDSISELRLVEAATEEEDA